MIINRIVAEGLMNRLTETEHLQLGYLLHKLILHNQHFQLLNIRWFCCINFFYIVDGFCIYKFVIQ